MRGSISFLLIAFSLNLFSCDEGGGKGGNGKDKVDPVILDDAMVTCDPTADMWDDLFVFEAWTSGPAESVTAKIWTGSSSEGSIRLNERNGGTWYNEVWGDDIDSDCDTFNRMSFEFTAQGDGDSDTAQVNP